MGSSKFDNSKQPSIDQLPEETIDQIAELANEPKLALVNKKFNRASK